MDSVDIKIKGPAQFLLLLRKVQISRGILMPSSNPVLFD